MLGFFLPVINSSQNLRNILGKKKSNRILILLLFFYSAYDLVAVTA